MARKTKEGREARKRELKSQNRKTSAVVTIIIIVAILAAVTSLIGRC